MKFEENSHCTFEEKVILVTKEILDVYPNIKKEEAIEIATLDEPISKQPDNDIKFMRYYYMLLVLQNNLEMRNIIYKEIYNIASQGLEDDKLSAIMDEINKFMYNERRDFPIISEVYNN